MRNLALYTIYDSPIDSRGFFVVRRWLVESCGQLVKANILGLYLDLEAARAAIQEVAPGTVKMERSESDDPVIVETWF